MVGLTKRWAFMGALMVAASAAPLLDRIAPDVEGYFMPVMKPLRLTTFRPGPDPNFTFFRFDADKIRDCGFRKLEIWVGPRGGRLSHQVDVVEYMGASLVRSLGKVKFASYWRASIRKQDLLTNSHMDVVHYCGWRPWVTRTAFFDSPPPGGDGTEQAP